ncbi:hypothetical protein D9M70_637100 [compost metagenome]
MLGTHPSGLVDRLHIARADPDFRLVSHMRHLQRQALGTHDVIGTKRSDQAALRPRDGLVQGARKPLVLLGEEIEAMYLLQPANTRNAVVTGAIVHHQQLHVRVALG